MYSKFGSNPVALADKEEISWLIIVVFASTAGLCPLLAVNMGTLGDVALNKIYFFAVAPDAGKSAVTQLRSI